MQRSIRLKYLFLLIVRWDGVVRPGQTTDDLVDFSDFFATIQEVTGGEGPTEYEIDGQSLLGRFKGDTDYEPRAYTFCHYEPFWGTPETGHWVRNQNYKVYGGGEIFHMSEDYWETTTLRTVEGNAAEVVDTLSAVLAKMKAEGSLPPYKLKRGQSFNDKNRSGKQKKKK